MLKDIYFLTPEKSCSADAAVLCCVPSACPNDPWPVLSERLAGVNINNRQSVSCYNQKPEKKIIGLAKNHEVSVGLDSAQCVAGWSRRRTGRQKRRSWSRRGALGVGQAALHKPGGCPRGQ